MYCIFQVFSLLETNRKSGVSYSGYTKFEPRIVARGIRLITVSYRLGFDLGPGLSVEVFGCSYGNETLFSVMFSCHVITKPNPIPNSNLLTNHISCSDNCQLNTLSQNKDIESRLSQKSVTTAMYGSVLPS